MPEYLLAAVRCECGGKLRWGTEATKRAPRLLGDLPGGGGERLAAEMERVGYQARVEEFAGGRSVESCLPVVRRNGQAGRVVIYETVRLDAASGTWLLPR